MLDVEVTPSADRCGHCGQNIAESKICDNDHSVVFCCLGCQSVFHTINSKGLSAFYSLTKSLGEAPQALQNYEEGLKTQDYSIFDREQFWKDYGAIEGDEVTLRFYVEGVSCYACVWLIEKLPELHPEIKRLDFNQQNYSLRITVKYGTPFSPLLKNLEKMGHRTRFLENFEEIQDWQIAEERELLKKLAVGGAAFGNIMLLAVAEYAGANGLWKKIFDYVSLFIAIPTVFYSGDIFFKSSYRALKNKTINLDFPLAVAILVGLIGSAVNIVRGEGHQYLDSVTGLIFLIIITRYIMRVSTRHAFKTPEIKRFFENGSVRIWNAAKNEFESVFYKYLKPNDKVQISSGQILPCDGVLCSPFAYLNLSFLNGESSVNKFTQGQELLAGSINSGPPIDLITTKIAEETELGYILSEINKAEEKFSKRVLASDRLAKYILSAIMAAGTVVFIYFAQKGEWETAFARFLSLFIVTCPCALSLATPMAMTRAFRALFKKGILVKNEKSLETVCEIENIFLDKTGTITEGVCVVLSCTELAPSPFPYSWGDVVLSLESISEHPLARALKNHFGQNSQCSLLPKLEGHREVIGKGVEATIADNHFFIGEYPQANSLTKTLALFLNETPVLKIELDDPLRKESKDFIAELKNILGNIDHIYILSGDKKKYVDATATSIGIKTQNALAELSSKEKALKIKEKKNTLMMGDGVNDALAMKNASLAIAVSGSMEASLRACDVYFSKKGPEQLLALFFIAKKVRRMIRRNTAISLLYNSTAAGLALSGLIGPLTASLVMPMASLTALISTIVEPLDCNESKVVRK